MNARDDQPETTEDHFDAAGDYIGTGDGGVDPAMTEDSVVDKDIDRPALAVGNEPYRS